jgi:hypothetical protein
MIRLRQESAMWAATAALLLGGATAQAALIPGSSLQPTVWLKADAANGVNAQGNPNALPANNAQISLWGDSSGNGRNATQSVLAQQPRFITNTANGKPVIRFDGSTTAGQGDFMNIVGGALANTDISKLTLFIVSNDNRATGDRNNKDILSTRDNKGNGWVETYEPSSAQQRYVHIGLGTTSNSVVDDNLATDKFHVLELRRDGLNIELGHDGALQVTDRLDEFKPTTLGVTQIANNNNDVNRFLRGDIAEIIAFDNTKLTDAQRSQVEQYLLNKYAITSAAPVPEPTSLAFLGLAGAAVLGRRRGR